MLALRGSCGGLRARCSHRWRHRTIGELYLLLTMAGALAIGAALLFAPHRMTSGPSLVILYSLAPRSTWAVVFIALAALAGAAASRPTEERFIVTMSIEVGAQTLWAVGLTLPSLAGADVSNILAPIAWLQLAGTALIILTSSRRPVLPPPAKGRRRTDVMG
jgi:hypothetical protein